MKTKIILSAAGFSGIFLASVFAADQTWNTGGPTDIWSTSAGDSNWDSNAVWTNGNTAIFSGTGETITASAVTASGMTFSGTGYTLMGGTITHSGTITTNESATVNSNIALTANQAWTAAIGKTLTLGGVIAGTSTLTYGGGGSYVINSINTNSGNLTIDGSAVTVNSGATLFGSGLGWAGRTVTIQNGGMLSASNFANGPGNLWGQIGDSTNNIILQSGGVFKMTGATMDSTVNKGFDVTAGNTGYFRVSTGTSSVWNGRYTGRDFNVNTGATLAFDGGGDFETSRYIRGAGNVTKNDGGTLKLTDVNGFTGTFTVNGGTLDAAKTTTGGLASALGSGANTIVVNSGGTLRISGDRGTGYHTGTVTINGGTITMDGSDLSFGSGKTVTFDTAPGTINGIGQWRIRDANAKVAVTAAASGSTISVTTLTPTFDISGGYVFEVADGAAANDLTISSNISGHSGNETIRKTGAGVLALTGSTTNTGAISVSAGTLLVNGSLGASSHVSVAASATVGGAGTIGGNLSFAPDSFFDIFLSISNPLDVGGTVAFGAGPSGPDSGFGIDNLTGVTWANVANGEYTLITGAVNTTNLDNLGSANAFDLGSGKSAYFESGSLKLVVVPEPSALLLGVIGSLALLRRRR